MDVWPDVFVADGQLHRFRVYGSGLDARRDQFRFALPARETCASLSSAPVPVPVRGSVRVVGGDANGVGVGTDSTELVLEGRLARSETADEAYVQVCVRHTPGPEDSNGYYRWYPFYVSGAGSVVASWADVAVSDGTAVSWTTLPVIFNR